MLEYTSYLNCCVVFIHVYCIGLFHVFKAFSLVSPTLKSLSYSRAFVDSVMCVLVVISSSIHVSYSHQTICTYITSKLTPCESVEIYYHVIYAYIIII